MQKFPSPTGTFAWAAEQRAVGGWRRAPVALLALSSTLVFMPWRSVDKYWQYRGMRPDLRVIQREFGRGLVLVAGREIPDYASAATFNPLDLGDPVPIYARNRQAASDSAVIAAFADRPVWFIDGPSITGSGYVVQAGPLSTADALRRVATEPDPAVTSGVVSRH